MKKFLKNVAALVAAAGACMLIINHLKKKQDDTITVEAEDITDSDDMSETVESPEESTDEEDAECGCVNQEEIVCEEKTE